ncbi:MAG: hypothetical protein GXO17_01480 [Thermodesulfobacteria bacterium]|nr:hypothetical protein [Thermodesulfobacteriota bacterium]
MPDDIRSPLSVVRTFFRVERPGEKPRREPRERKRPKKRPRNMGKKGPKIDIRV